MPPGLCHIGSAWFLCAVALRCCATCAETHLMRDGLASLDVRHHPRDLVVGQFESSRPVERLASKMAAEKPGKLQRADHGSGDHDGNDEHHVQVGGAHQ